MLLFATLVIVVTKFFRAGIFGVIAARLKERGLIGKAPPLTEEQGALHRHMPSREAGWSPRRSRSGGVAVDRERVIRAPRSCSPG